MRHPERSTYSLIRGIRNYACCQNDFYFSSLLCDDVQPNLLDNETAVGCTLDFHTPVK